MLLVQREFDEREREVTRYFDFLRHFNDHQIVFQIPETAATTLPEEVEELFKTLKANGFLLLYNLVESTLKNAIEAIFEEFRLKSVSFDACRLEVREVILRNLKRHDVKKIVSSLSAISTDVVVATFRKENLAAGNVDARLIREIAGLYGFSNPRVKSDELLTVKTNRNDLAHGLKSFAEVGRDFDLERLEQIKTEVIIFLSALLESVAEYLTERSYLAVFETT
jgi:hypothetical protein